MSPDRKKPGVAFWATVVVVVLASYPLSFGPACWFASRTGIGIRALPFVFRPLTAVMVTDTSPADLRRRLTLPSGATYRITSLYFVPRGWVSKYACLFARDDWNWRFVAQVENNPDPVVRLNEGYWEWCCTSKR